MPLHFLNLVILLQQSLIAIVLNFVNFIFVSFLRLLQISLNLEHIFRELLDANTLLQQLFSQLAYFFLNESSIFLAEGNDSMCARLL